MMKRSVSSCLALSLLSATSFAQGKVWTVDDDIGNDPDFTSIADAVLFAEDGDTILVADGTYLSFTINGESLSVLADEGADVVISGGLSFVTNVIVRNLAPDQAVTLKGFSVEPALGLGSQVGSISLLDNQGDVWIEDVQSRGNAQLFGTFVFATTPALEVVNSSSVLLARSNFTSAVLTTGTQANEGEAGAVATNSTVAAYDCLFAGLEAAGGTAAFLPCTPAGLKGGDGFLLESGELFASGCTFLGGDGGAGQSASIFLGAGEGGQAGSGLRSLDPGAVVTLRDSSLQAGAAGHGGLQGDGMPCADGLPVPALEAAGATGTLAGPALPFSVSSPLRVGEPGTFSYAGQLGDQVFVVVSLNQDMPALVSDIGYLALGPVTRTFALGTIGPAGTLELPVVFTSTGPNDFRTYFLQGLVLTTGLELVLTAPASLTILDAGF